MGLFEQGIIEKLTIGTYESADYKKRVEEGAFKAFINPNSYSVLYKTKLNGVQAPGNSKVVKKYIASDSTDLDLEFLFDGTGVTEANSGNALVNAVQVARKKRKEFAETSVQQQLEDFYNATGKLDGATHKPHNVIINWGDFEFKGILAEFSVNYKLFDSSGLPLRAIGKAKFCESIGPELNAAMDNKNSPEAYLW